MTAADRTMQWREDSGELAYLSIRLLGFVAELPARSLPPRGRVSWSATELAELGRLTHALSRGETDAARAVESMGAIDELFRRPYVIADSGNSGDAALAAYLVHRNTAMQSLPRLQHLASAQPAKAPVSRPPDTVPWWQAALRLLRKV